MANDAFEQQIVDLVRKMPDAAIIALVKDRLGSVIGAGAVVAPAAAIVPAAATKRRGRPARCRGPLPRVGGQLHLSAQR